MMSSLKRLFWLNRVEPVTHNDVDPAPREPEKEREIKAAQAALAHQVLSVGRTSWEIRQELAGNVLAIVAGD